MAEHDVAMGVGEQSLVNGLHLLISEAVQRQTADLSAMLQDEQTARKELQGRVDVLDGQLQVALNLLSQLAGGQGQGQGQGHAQDNTRFMTQQHSLSSIRQSGGTETGSAQTPSMLVASSKPPSQLHRSMVEQDERHAVVELNVGGTVFTTTYQSLTQVSDSFLGALLSGRHTLTRDKEGNVFIDRDPRHFVYILAWLRDPGAPHSFPLHDQEFLHELEYYGLFNEIAGSNIADNDAESIIYGSEVYALGSSSPNERYNAQDNTWIPIATSDLARKDASYVWHSGKLFAIGGRGRHHAIDAVEMYDSKTNSWVVVPSMGFARYKCAVLAHGPFIYVIGGYGDDHLPLSHVERYNVASLLWEQLPDLTQCKGGVVAVIYADMLFVFGGCARVEATGPGIFPLLSVERLDIQEYNSQEGSNDHATHLPRAMSRDTESNGWSPSQTTPTETAATGTATAVSTVVSVPSQHSTPSMAAHQSPHGSPQSLRHIHLHSQSFQGVAASAAASQGNSVSDSQQQQQGNTTTQWRACAPMPFPHFHTSVVVCGEYIYLCGGLSAEPTQTVHRKVNRYHPPTDTWREVHSMTTKRFQLALCASIDGCIYVAGGSNPVALETCERFDPTHNSWTMLPAMNQPRHFFAATVCQGKLITVGGMWYRRDRRSQRVGGSAAVPTVEAFDPATNKWQSIASLCQPRSHGTCIGTDAPP
eukprot:m.86274 g.86274  ORF g.86274 m.86274 type:complete len:702 (+) comp12799_c0_seq7:170-2275(+)